MLGFLKYELKLIWRVQKELSPVANKLLINWLITNKRLVLITAFSIVLCSKHASKIRTLCETSSALMLYLRIYSISNSHSHVAYFFERNAAVGFIGLE